MGGPVIEVVRGDITSQHVDAVVNAANASLLGGGGVDGAIHRAGGPAILEACRHLRATVYPDGLPTGWAAPTTAGDLDATWVIHAVGPVYASDPAPSVNLARCHGSVLRVADHVGARTVALPAISTGVYGYPLHEAAGVAMLTVTTVPTDVQLVRFVLWSEEAFVEYDHARGAAETRREERLDALEAERAAILAAMPPVEGLPRPMPGPDYPGDGWIGRSALRGIDDVLGGFLDAF
jgi:O-acetyl-ADP-ribose deacetylase (regulator of RNase III)